MKKKINVLLIEDNGGDIELILEAFNSHSTRLGISVMDNGEDALLSLKSEEGISPALFYLILTCLKWMAGKYCIL